LTPTHTVSGSEGSRSASPDSRIQWHRYEASPPSTSSTSASRTQGPHRSAPMVGSAVSSRTPSDAQPRPEKCRKSGSAATRRATDTGPHIGCPHCAVGTTRAWHCATGFPSSCTSAEWMLGFVTPPDVSKSFKVPPRGREIGGTCWRPGTVLELIAATAARAKRGVRPTALRGGHLSHQEVEDRFGTLRGSPTRTASPSPGAWKGTAVEVVGGVLRSGETEARRRSPAAPQAQDARSQGRRLAFS